MQVFFFFHASIFIQRLKDKPLEIVLLAQRKSIFKIIKYVTKFPFKTLFQSTLLPPLVRGLFPNHPLINSEFSVSLVLVDLVGKKKVLILYIWRYSFSFFQFLGDF